MSGWKHLLGDIYVSRPIAPVGLRRAISRPRLKIGARDRTRTCTPYGTRPSNVCVYQFHHPSISKEERGLRPITRCL